MPARLDEPAALAASTIGSSSDLPIAVADAAAQT